MREPGRALRHRRVAAVGLHLVLATVCIVGAAACSRGDAAPRGTLVNARESDYKLTTQRLAAPAGYVTFRIHNAGPSTHEFIVARSEVAVDALPLRANGITVDEDAKELHPAGELGDIRLDSTRNLTLKLAPGRYALYCNLEGHYRGGMYALLEVTS